MKWDEKDGEGVSPTGMWKKNAPGEKNSQNMSWLACCETTRWPVWFGRCMELDHKGSCWPLLESGLLFGVQQEPQDSFRKNSDRIRQAEQAADNRQ